MRLGDRNKVKLAYWEKLAISQLEIFIPYKAYILKARVFLFIMNLFKHMCT